MINIKVNKKLVSIFLLFALVLVATAAVSATDSDQTTAVSDDSSLDTSSSDTVATSDSSASTTSSSAATTDNSATSSSSSSGDVKTTASSDTTTQKADTSSSTNVKESSSSSQASTTTSAADTNTVSTKSVDTHTVSSDSSSKTLSTADQSKEASNYAELAGDVAGFKETPEDGDSYTIDLTSSEYTADSTINWDTDDVATSLTINGNGATITADGSHQFITVGADNILTLKEMTITGFSADEGGAIYTEGTLILDNVNFISNEATQKGGAVYGSEDSEITITAGSFTDNTQTEMTDANNNGYGGAALYTSGSLTITGTEFTNNKCEYTDDTDGNQGNGGNGGAINVYDSTGKISITDATFDENSARHGGAIYIVGDLEEVLIDTCTFTGNVAIYGGAIETYSDMTIQDSTFETNEATGIGSDNRESMGGAICINGAAGNSPEVTITDSTFTGNSATDGGAIFNDGTLTVENSEFINNIAETDGGAILVNGYREASIDGTTFTGNTAGENGGAIGSSGTNVEITITDSTFESNTAQKGGAFGTYATSSSGSSSLTISGSTFTDNEAEDGTAISSVITVTMDDESPSTITANVVGFYSEEDGKTKVTAPITDSNLNDGTTVKFYYKDEAGVEQSVDALVSGGVATAELPIAPGDHTIIVEYPEGTTYENTIIMLYVDVTNTVLTVDPIEDKYNVNDTLTVSGTLTNDGTTPLTGQNVTITLKIEESVVTDPVNATVDVNGNYVADVTLPATANTYTVVVTYEGNEEQEDRTVSQQVVVDPLDTYIVITVSPEEGIAYGDFVDVTVELFDENGVQIPYPVEGLTLTLNGEDVELTDVHGVATAFLTADKNGINNLVANYGGLTSVYNEAEPVTATFDVEGIAAEIVLDQDVVAVLDGQTFDVTGTLVSEFGSVEGKELQLSIYLKDKFGDYVLYPVATSTTNDDDGVFTFEGITTEIPDYGVIADGEYTLVVSLVDDELVADSVELKLVVGRTSPILTVEDVTDYTTDTQITITGTLFATDGETPLTGEQVFLYDEDDNQIGEPATVQDDGTYTFIIPNQGTEKLTVKFNGNDEYTDASEKVTVTVLKVTATIENVDVPDGVPTEDTTITGTLVDNYGNAIADQEINIFIDNVIVGTGVTDKDGNFAVTIDPLDEGTYNLVIEYGGNDDYTAATISETLTVAKLDATLTVNADDVLYTEETIISGTLMDGETPIADAEVYVTVGDEIVGTVTTDEFGYYEIAYTATTTGEFTVVAQYAGDDKYNAAEATDTFTVSTVETQITVPDVSGKVNETVDLTAIVTDTEGNPITTGDVIFKINGKTLKDEDGNTITVAVDENGVATLPYVLDHTPKDYVLTASYIGDEIYERADSDNATITVKKVKADTITTVSDVIGTINSTVDLTATVVDEYGDPVTSGEVSFKLNGVTIKDEEGNTLTAPVVDGVATLPYVLDHSAKTYNITAVYAGDSDYASSRDESGVLTVEKGVLDTTIIVSDVTGKQGETVDLVATIVDENGNVVLDGSVVFKLNGVTIKDEDGNAILVDVVDGVATLPYEVVNSAKDYTISATYSGSEYYTSSRTEEDATLTVLDQLSAIVTPVDVSGKMAETVDLTATVTDVDGNAVNSGKVAFKLNGVTLKDENGDVIYADVEDGIATLPYEIVNSPKDYTITALYYSDDQSVIKNAKSKDDAVLTVEKYDITATLDDITITQGENANIVFTIYDENGDQVTKDTKVVVKANGKTQVSTTVVNGEANIELPSESFKNPTYDITVVIGENSYYNGLTLDATLYVE